jgi:hypothetical protein
VKVIKQGALPKPREWRASCKHCQTLFSFVEHEAVHGTDAGGHYMKVRCPLVECSHELRLRPDERDEVR